MTVTKHTTTTLRCDFCFRKLGPEEEFYIDTYVENTPRYEMRMFLPGTQWLQMDACKDCHEKMLDFLAKLRGV